MLKSSKLPRSKFDRALLPHLGQSIFVMLRLIAYFCYRYPPWLQHSVDEIVQAKNELSVAPIWKKKPKMQWINNDMLNDIWKTQFYKYN